VISLRREGKVPRRVAAALLVLYALLYIFPLGWRPVTSPDEARYGEIAREMLASGDWISPRFNGVRYFEKPVLGYWLNAASLAALGENAFALRLPAALATGLTALIVFLLARRFLTPLAASLATCIFLTTFLVGGVGTLAVLDALLSLFVTAALAAYYLAIVEERAGRRYAWLAACGAACAGAFLVKGFVALAIAVVVATPYLIARRRWPTLFASPWLPIVTAAALALPWALAIHAREPDYWHYFFWVQHVQRFAGTDAQHAQPFWYYLAYLPLTGWPWILFLPAALSGLRRSRVASDGERAFLWYVAAWALLPVLFLSLAHGKMQTYILPCFAPLAILLAAGLERYFAEKDRRAVRIAGAVMAVALVTLLGAALTMQTMRGGDSLYGSTELAKLVVLGGALICGAGCAAVVVRRASRASALAAVAGVSAAVLVPLQLALPDRLLELFAPVTAIAHYASVPRDALIVSEASLFGATAWALKRDDIYVISPGEIEYGLSYPESGHRWLKGAMLARLIDENRGRREILIVGQSSSAPGIEPQLPAHAKRSEQGRVTFWRIAASAS
jgi:4-amino-4-deoxy-L-arabinose transferase